MKGTHNHYDTLHCGHLPAQAACFLSSQITAGRLMINLLYAGGDPGAAVGSGLQVVSCSVIGHSCSK